MIKRLSDREKKILKKMKLDRLYYYLRGIVFLNKIAVPVEKDLTAVPPIDANVLRRAGLELVELSADAIGDGQQNAKFLYPGEANAENRFEKALQYLSRGYRGVALVRGNTICGDIWYAAGRPDGKAPIHPDTKWLGLQCGQNEAYAFDMHLHPAERGKNAATLLQHALLEHIRRKGFTKAYGYYWAQNIPALWVHRMLKWRELERVKVSSFFFIRLSRASSPSGKTRLEIPARPRFRLFRF